MPNLLRLNEINYTLNKFLYPPNGVKFSQFHEFAQYKLTTTKYHCSAHMLRTEHKLIYLQLSSLPVNACFVHLIPITQM